MQLKIRLIQGGMRLNNPFITGWYAAKKNPLIQGGMRLNNPFTTGWYAAK